MNPPRMTVDQIDRLVEIISAGHREAAIAGEAVYDPRWHNTSEGSDIRVEQVLRHEEGIQVIANIGCWRFTDVVGGWIVVTEGTSESTWSVSSHLTITGVLVACAGTQGVSLIGRQIEFVIQRGQARPRTGGPCTVPLLERFAERVCAATRSIGISGDALVDGEYLGGRPWEHDVTVESCRWEDGKLVLRARVPQDTWSASTVVDAHISHTRGFHYGTWRAAGSVSWTSLDLHGPGVRAGGSTLFGGIAEHTLDVVGYP